MVTWTEADIPDQTGRTVLVTGANSGLGLRGALVLAARGARVLMACRSPEKGAEAVKAVAADAAAGGSAELVPLDLADLASVRQAAATVRELTGDRLDVLMNNAGVMMTPKRTTKDGFELQFGTNHLGHAALTWLLMPALRAAAGARVVTMSSLFARMGRLDLADPNFEYRRYLPGAAYGQSKLANLTFTVELDRRLRAEGADVTSVAAHPGYTVTELSANMARSRQGPLRTLMEFGGEIGNRLFGQDVRVGVLPQLYAATAADVRGGEYYGPSGPGQSRGYPTRVGVLPAAADPAAGSTLWALTAELTRVAPDPE